MKFLVVENDHLQYEWIKDSLQGSFFGSWNIERIRTELEFCNSLERIAKERPNVIIMDVMLQWTTASENLEREEPPPHVATEGHHRAGLRCERRLSENPRTRTIPVILYTVLERADLEEKLVNLPKHVKHLRKESDPESLLQLISEVMKLPQPSF
jgi:CheY-like chemotaxis protein